MSDLPDWLPQPISYSTYGGDWERFLTDVYETFVRDLRSGNLRFRQQPLTLDSRMEDGKEAAYWHLVTRRHPTTDDRELELRRCERIPWIRAIIENEADKAISTWQSTRNKQTRIYLWLEDHDYLVILAAMRRVAVLVTAYCTDMSSEREKLRKERGKFLAEMQKPP